MASWGDELVKCIGCKKSYPLKSTVVTATNNSDGSSIRMCDKCYNRGKKSLGGWKGIVEGNPADLAEARQMMWSALDWNGLSDSLDDGLAEANLNWEPIERADYKDS